MQQFPRRVARLAALVTFGLALAACQSGPATRARSSVRAEASQGAALRSSSVPTPVAPASSTLPDPPRDRVSAWPPPPRSGVASDFCIETVHALDDESCYVLPDAPTRELLLYLHGIVPPATTSVQKTRFQTVVANGARRAGVAALMPRGRRGLGPKGREDYWGWPTSAAAHQRLARELVASFAAKRAKLEALVGSAFTHLYVAGSSSGAYFAVALALHADLEADAFGAMSGGALPALLSLEKLTPKPFYVGFGVQDSVASGARALATRLREAGWPVELAVHPLPHGAQEIYLDEAFAFWRARLGVTTKSSDSP